MRPALPSAALHAARLVALVATALASASAAQAQVPGNYRGTTAQGQPLLVQVSAAPGGGTEVTQIQAMYRTTCALGGPPIDLASIVWGFFPIGADGSFDASYLWDRDYFRTTGVFAADGSVAGDTTWSLAAVTRRAPHAGEVCAAPVLPWNGAFTGSNAIAGNLKAVAPLNPQFRLEQRFDRAGRLVERRVLPLR